MYVLTVACHPTHHTAKIKKAMPQQLLAQPSALHHHSPLTIHQRNFPFVQPLTIRVTTSSSPVTTLSPALSETNRFSSHLRRRGAPGGSQPPTQKPSLCVDPRGLWQKRAVATFPFSCTADPSDGP
jgi:hypothetical protein